MENQKIEDYYSEHSSTIFSEMLGEDENYQRLKKAKLAAEKALQNVISKEAWKQYLALDEIGNELECEYGGLRRFGIAASMDFLLICTYEENGKNPELIVYKKR